MAIEKKLIHFGRLADFETQLTAGNILDYSIVFIQDAKKIWTHGTYYDCSEAEDISSISWDDVKNKPTFATVATSGSYNDLSDKPTIPSAVTESTVSGWGFTKNTGTYSKPSTGIPKTDLASAVQTSLGKADTALQAHQDISGKQDKLVSGTNIKTINGTSLLGSGNIVISGGGGDSGGSGAYSEVSHGTSDTTFALTPNTFHVWDEVASLTLTLGDETAGVANEFLFQFNSGSTATTLTLPDSLKWANDSAPTIEANKIYQVSILKGLASVLVFDSEPEVVLITFTIGSTEYQAEEGMTWTVFVNSEYNTSNLRVQPPYIMTRYGEVVGTSSSNYVSSTDVIIENTNYVAVMPI